MSDIRPEWFDDPEFPWVQELLGGANISASDMFHVEFSRNHRTSSASLPAGNGRLTPSSPRLSGGGTRWPTLNFRGGPFDIHFDAGEWLDVLNGTTIARQYLTLEEQLAAFEQSPEIAKLQGLKPLPLLRQARDRWVDALGDISGEPDTPTWPTTITTPDWMRRLDHALLHQGFTRGWTVHGNTGEPIGCVRQRGPLRILLAIDIYGPQLNVQRWPKQTWTTFTEIPPVLGLHQINPATNDPDTIIQLIELFIDTGYGTTRSTHRMAEILQRGPLGAGTGPWHNQRFYRPRVDILDFGNQQLDQRRIDAHNFWHPKHHTPETLSGGPHNQLVLQPGVHPDDLDPIIRFTYGYFISEAIADILRPTAPDAIFTECWAHHRKYFIFDLAASSQHSPIDPNRSYLFSTFGGQLGGTAVGALAVDPTLIGRPGHTMGHRSADLIVSEATAHAINTTAGATLFEPVWDPDLVNTYRNHPHQMLPSRFETLLDTLRQQQELGILRTPHTNHNND